MTLTPEAYENLKAILAAIANVEKINESGEPSTLSLAELQQLGTDGLNIIDQIEE